MSEQKRKPFAIAMLHVLSWTVFFLVIVLSRDFQTQRLLIIPEVIKGAIVMVLFYVNYLWLIPRFLFKRKLLKYILIFGVFFGSLFAINLKVTIHYMVIRLENRRAEIKEDTKGQFNSSDYIVYRPEMVKRMTRRKYFETLYIFLTFWAISTFIRVLMKWYADEKKRGVQERSRLDAELKFLKTQINPHFLFNSLNSIFALANRKSDETTDAILKLSSILRYILYEAENSPVSLQQEIDHVNNYIALQKLRLTEKVKIEQDFKIGDATYSIEPLLLIPLVENAIKYGVDSSKESLIRFSLHIEDQILHFKTKNTIVAKPIIGEEKNSGIGLKNLERRLHLSYGDFATLRTYVKEGIFYAELQINLKKHAVYSS